MNKYDRCRKDLGPAKLANYGPMRVIALIEDRGVIRRSLEYLGLWAPLDPANWPRHASLALTYHPVPDIATCRTETTSSKQSGRGKALAALWWLE